MLLSAIDITLSSSQRSPRRSTILSGLVGAAATLMLCLGASPAYAGVGIAVVLDLPQQVRAGTHAGSITIANVNSDVDTSSSNLVFDITVTPSCGSQAVADACPRGAEDPGVFRINPVATGRAGSACEGTVFSVESVDSDSGQVMFNAPEGHVALGAANGPDNRRQCVIDFSFNVTGSPVKGALARGRVTGAATTAYAGAWAMSTAGMRPGVGANLTTVQVQ